MGTVCPTVATTIWLSIGEFCSWLISNRHRIQEYLDEKSPDITPDSNWWLLLYAVHFVMCEVNLCFRYIQGKGTFLQQQTQRFQTLLSFLFDSVGIEVIESSVDLQ